MQFFVSLKSPSSMTGEDCLNVVKLSVGEQLTEFPEMEIFFSFYSLQLLGG